MVQSRVSAHAKGKMVVVKYDGNTIRKIEPEEAIECGGKIAAVGRRLTDVSDPENVDPGYSVKKASSRSSGAKYPDNKSATHGSQGNKRDNDDEGEDDWRGPNKNSLINGSL